MSRNGTILLWTILAALLGACTGTAPQLPATWDGLEYRSGGPADALYWRPGAPSQTYRTVVIDPLVVSMAENWQPPRDLENGTVVGRHRISSSEVRYVTDSIEPMLRAAFEKELAAGGYEVVDRPGPTTLRVRAGLANVYLDTPTQSLGRLHDDDTMTLVLDLSDAPTGQLLGRLVDEKRGKMGPLGFPNSLLVNVDFRRALQSWAERLRTTLDAMNAAGS